VRLGVYDFSEPEDIQNLRFILNSHAWINFFTPRLQEQIDYAYDVLKLEPSQRAHQESDALLRATIQVLEKLLDLGHGETLQEDANREREVRMRDEEYRQRAEEGRYGPS
jgi:hypothetical protein